MVHQDAAGKSVPVRTPDDWNKRRAHIFANMQLAMGPLPRARAVPGRIAAGVEKLHSTSDGPRRVGSAARQSVGVSTCEIRVRFCPIFPLARWAKAVYSSGRASALTGRNRGKACSVLQGMRRGDHPIGCASGAAQVGRSPLQMPDKRRPADIAALAQSVERRFRKA